MNGRLLRLAVVVFFCLAGSAGAAEHWTSIGPNHASVLTLDVDPTNPSILYAGTVLGPYKSTDGGANWQWLPNDLPGGNAVRLYLAKSRPTTLYALVAGYVYKSVDSGVRWTYANLSGMAEISVSPTNADAVFATLPAPPTQQGGMQGPILFLPNLVTGYRTADGGATWTQVEIYEGNNIRVFLHAPAWGGAGDLNSMYASAVVYTYTSQGQSQYTITTANATFLSRGGGATATWARFTIPQFNEPFNAVYGLATNPLNGRIYAFSTRDLLDSLDGVNWRLVVDVGQIVTSIAFDPVDANRLFVRTSGQLFETLNAGASWTAVPVVAFQFSSGCPGGVVIDPVTRTTLYDYGCSAFVVASTPHPDGVMKSVNDGASWASATVGISNTPMRVTAAPSNGAYLYAETGAAALRSFDGGQSWQQLAVRPYPWSLAVDPADPLTVYGNSNNQVNRTTNGWTNFQFSPAPNQLVTFAPSLPSTMYSVSSTQLSKSIDGGVTWTPMASWSALFNLNITVAPSTPSTLFIYNTSPPSAPTILKSIDGGATVTQIGQSLSGTLFSLNVDPRSASTLYVRLYNVVNSAAVYSSYRSTDGGTTWTTITLPEPGIVWGWTIDPASNAIFAAQLGGVYMSTDEAATWVPLGLPGAQTLNFVGGANPRLYAGTQANGAWVLDIPAARISGVADRASARIGKTLTFHASSPGGMQPAQFRFLIGDTVIQDFSTSATLQWTPGGAAQGPQVLTVEARDPVTGQVVRRFSANLFIEAAEEAIAKVPFRYNHDAFMDLLLFNRQTGTWSVQLGSSTGWRSVALTGGWSTGWDIHVADFNGDGLDDFFLYNPQSGAWYKVINTGAGFSYFSQGWQPGLNVYVVDFNHDGKADVFVYNPIGGAWFTCVSTGDGTTLFDYQNGEWSPGWRVFPADFSGDDITDFFLYDPIGGLHYKVITQTPSLAFSYTAVGQWAPGWSPMVADFDADGHADLFIYNPATGLWYRCLSTGGGTGDFTYQAGQWATGWQVDVADFDADGRTDLFLYDPGSGLWYKALTATGSPDGFNYFVGTWGRWTTAVVDLDGDGRSDLFLSDPSSGLWYQAITNTPGTFTYQVGTFQ